ncbi:MAG: hypothetical protein COW71_03765 [Ignavibacteriales bacterium CG18_big_fil_WC_8_21_14_2_50_31_20]|nr:MAG: hypothetical protein COW71_03765 [Ignavibacteriales bacterium CG18_big_fil_WC_8_21_14_2_50_31_20]
MAQEKIRKTKLNNPNFKLIIILALIFITTIFLLQNTQVVNINVLIWTYYMSVSLIVISMLIVGTLFGWFMKSYVNHKKKKKAEKQLVEESEID